MKNLFQFVAAFVAAATLFIAGCASDAGASKTAPVDTSSLQKAFSSADAGVKGSADKVIAAVKAQDYPTAATELQKLAGEVQLTPDQKKAVDTLLGEVKGKLPASVNSLLGK